MKRRRFLQVSGQAALVGVISPGLGFLRAASPMDRIGLTTVTFRSRFAKTAFGRHPALDLRDVPKYFADRFGIRNIEIWSRHFDSTDKAYLEEINKAVQKAQSRVINIQLSDADDHLSAKDENKRRRSLAATREWIDITARLGCPSIRVNTGGGDLDVCVDSFKSLNQYALTKGVKILVENHGGLSADPDKHLRILKEVGSENCRSLPDFANYPVAIRYEALARIMPYADLISAKVTELKETGEHPEFDVARCIKIAKDAGFNGIYSIEQWDPKEDRQLAYYERATDWLLKLLKESI